jgi:hypothetical protein
LQVAHVGATLKALAKEDQERFAERREKMAAESRENATRQRLKRLERAQEEEARFRSTRERTLGAASASYAEQFARLMSEVEAAHVQGSPRGGALYSELRELVESRLVALRRAIAEVEGTLVPVTAEAEKLSAAEAELARRRRTLCPPPPPTTPTTPIPHSFLPFVFANAYSTRVGNPGM